MNPRHKQTKHVRRVAERKRKKAAKKMSREEIVIRMIRAGLVNDGYEGIHDDGRNLPGLEVTEERHRENLRIVDRLAQHLEAAADSHDLAALFRCPPYTIGQAALLEKADIGRYVL